MKKNRISSAYVCLCNVLMLTACFLLSACQDKFDPSHPEVSAFVSQLKSGTLETADGAFPRFTEAHIDELLQYADDLSDIPSFPLAAVSYPSGGKLRLGECILWTVESIRVGHPASMGSKMVHVDADDYEGIYFLSDNEVLDAVARYRRWWQTRQYPRTMWTIDPCRDEPLCGSGYMWW